MGDLINPGGGPLPVRGSSSGGFYVEELSVVQARAIRRRAIIRRRALGAQFSDAAPLPCAVPHGARPAACDRRGLDNRRKRHHQLNSDSSRSHAIFSVYLDAAEVGSDGDGGGEGGGAVRYGRISLCDLAGSENVRASGSQGVGLKEAGSINKSLFALGQVIKALAAEGLGRRVAHVPYRDATLTKLLSDSLGGNAMSLMIACCTPQLSYVEESLRTVHYACTAGAIRNRPSVKLDPQEQLILYLKKEVRELQAEGAAAHVAARRLPPPPRLARPRLLPRRLAVGLRRALFPRRRFGRADRPTALEASVARVGDGRPAPRVDAALRPPLRRGAWDCTAHPDGHDLPRDPTGGAPAPSARKPSVRGAPAAAPAPPELRPVGPPPVPPAVPALPRAVAVRLTREGRWTGRRRRRRVGGGAAAGSGGASRASRASRAALENVV